MEDAIERKREMSLTPFGLSFGPFGPLLVLWTINRLKGKVTMISIPHQAPKGLQVDEVVNTGN